MKNNYDLIIKEKSFLVLFALRKSTKPKYGKILAREAVCTLSYITKVLVTFEKIGLVTSSIEGRIKLVTLTPKGIKLTDQLQKIHELLVI